MSHSTRITTIFICATSLAACTVDRPDSYNYQGIYSYDIKTYANTDYNYYPNYGRESYDYPAERKQVVVPETYHVGAYHSPTSHKDIDKQWVQSQNPQAYTIEVADGEKAAQVAGKMQKAPKSDRMAEIRYNREGKSYYKGVYGTYDNYESAQQALNTLPPEVKEGANIKPWANIQSTVNE